MPPTPSSTHPSALLGADQDEYEPVIKRRPNSDNTEPSTAALHRLSFPSLNDFKPLSLPSSPPHTSATNHAPPTTPPQSYTPLTLKSVRLAKSKSKLRQDPHIGVATGSRRNSLPKSAHSALASGGDNSGTGSPPSSLPPPLPTPSSSADSPGSSGSMLARRNTEGSLLSAFQHSGDLSPARRRETSSNSGCNTPPVMPRPILKDTSARDKVQRESWMSEAVGIPTSGNYASGLGRPSSNAQSPSPIAPPKSLARNNSASKRQSRLPRMSIPDYDQDALTPRPRQGNGGYGPDYKPRRQSGGPGHLLYAFDRNASSAEFESEDYDESDPEDDQIHSQHLQEQYSRLQRSHSRQSTVEAGEEGAPISKKPQRKSLGDELDVPPVPEKSSQRKRVSTMGSTTLPTLSPSLSAALTAATNSAASASETLSSIVRSNHPPPKDRSRPYGSVGANSLSFEPLFALKDNNNNNNLRPAQSAGHLQVGNKDVSAKRLSAAVSDADGYAALLTVDPSQQGVSILDISKRELTEIPSGLPESITHLRLAYNMIQVLAPISSLTTLNNLQVLDLCDNQLELLPSEIGLLTKLKELYLSNNKLCKLPDTIQKMARLEVLDIRNNQFYLLNPALAKMKALRQLDVRNNHLNAIPAPLCMLSATLTALLVDGNQFVQPFFDLLQPLMMDDSESITSGRQSFLGDDPYGDPNSKKTPLLAARPVSVYEPWRREAAPISTRRAGGALGSPAMVKRRSHGDLMTLIGLQRKDGGASTEDLFALTSDPAVPRSNTISVSSGAYIASVMGAETMSSRRERSVSTSTITPATEQYADYQGSNSPSASHPLSLNKFLKSIRKSSKSSLRESQFSTRSDATKRFSIGSEVDPMGDLESDHQEPETRPNSKGTVSSMGGVNGRRAPAGGINQWVRDRFHKRTNSSDMGALSGGHASVTSISTEAMESSEGYTVRDSGYGVISGSAGSQSSPSLNSTPDMALTSSQGKSYGLLGNRYQNKSTGHLPFGTISARDSQGLSSSFDPAQRKERNYRYSCMSIESQMTQGTEHDSDLVELDSAIAHHIQQQHQHHQHRMSSMHSPTTPLPSSPVISGGISNGSHPNHWNAGSPRYGQSATAIKPLMQYLRDLHDLDPDSSEWEEVYAWRRVWNAERSTPVGLGVSSDGVDVEDDEEDQEKKQAKDEEIRLAKLQAQASRRRRIVDEIVTTERTYVEGLKGLVEIYLTPALQVMPSSDHKAVFSNARSIYTFHTDHFLPALEKAFRVTSEPTTAASLAVGQEQDSETVQSVTTPMSPVPSTGPFASTTTTTSSISASSGQVSNVSSSSKDETSVETADSEASKSPSTTGRAAAAAAAAKPVVEDRIGRVFAEHVDYMKMYSFYINNFDNALRVLQTQLTQAKHKKKMKEFLRRCAKHPNHTQLALQGYLLLPVQRIPRYKLLLQDLLENTWPEHVDYQDIATALEKISSRADEMNERKRQYENHEKVLLVQNRIIGQYKTPLVQPHRKVVREGMLHLIRIVTRNVSMGLDKVVPINDHCQEPSLQQQQPQQQNNGDLTVHHLSEETVEKSFLFILFNDIMIQCNPVTGKAVGGGVNGINYNSGSGGVGGGVNGHVSTDATTSGSAAGGASDARIKNLELCRVLQLESRLHPAEVVGQDVLRVVDDGMVLYLTGDKDVIHAWKEDINSRW
ncbi:hypothetical protein BGZ67_010346 [Mortierella alpina]|nr:hypothetical protein BGZ67_010346 [Mortierella alpina]